MSSHTPGPWEVAGDGFRIWSQAGQRIVALTATNNSGRTLQGAADAQLIAAAPDMLAALELMLNGVDVEGKEIIDAMKAAVAKAKGEPVAEG